MIKAGDLNQRLALETKTFTENSFGEREDSWQTLATVWAAKRLFSQKDIAKQSGELSQAEVKFLIRYRSDVTSDMRFQYKGDTYYITALEETLDDTGLIIFGRKNR
ncbi:phage head closure protein [Qipengyuania citrea]|uniref:phage head closure protein n=1 Tax=Qipengyuania citrea TaxID=225971 RepID=UPI001E5F5C28|nr:phage head closure protein [Qipengyuania citrea]MCD1591807.1 phage head closure protein [Qipengyuania citrea]